MARDIVIRPMAIEDLARVAELEEQCFTSPWLPEMFVAEMEGPCSHTRVLLVESELVAYATFRVIFEEAHLFNIAVDPALRGRGYSRLLMDEIIAASLGLKAETMYLEVRASNEVARKLYESYKFYPIGRRKKYYEDGEDAVVMECRLEEALSSR